MNKNKKNYTDEECKQRRNVIIAVCSVAMLIAVVMISASLFSGYKPFA